MFSPRILEDLGCHVFFGPTSDFFPRCRRDSRESVQSEVGIFTTWVTGGNLTPTRLVYHIKGLGFCRGKFQGIFFSQLIFLFFRVKSWENISMEFSQVVKKWWLTWWFVTVGYQTKVFFTIFHGPFGEDVVCLSFLSKHRCPSKSKPKKNVWYLGSMIDMCEMNQWLLPYCFASLFCSFCLIWSTWLFSNDYVDHKD